MKILVVEDNADNAELLRLILEPYGDVDTAPDGLDALDKIGKLLDQQATYDLVLLDVRMPRLDGLETLNRLRLEEQHRNIPGLRTKVIMITAYADEQAMQRAFQLGCEGYLFKTQGKDKIIERLKALGLIEPA